MPRRRLGVALVLPEPVATEIDGLRRALGDATLGRIPAHLTLVPPVNVADDDLPAALHGLHGLRDRVFRSPLERTLSRAFVPHVTVADEIDPGRIPAAVAALADYVVDVTVDGVHLLEEGRGRVWRPIAETSFTRRWLPG